MLNDGGVAGLKPAKYGLPSRVYYSIADASCIAKCSINDFLHYAGMGKVGLVVAVPPGVKVYPYDIYAQYSGFPIFVPELLSLRISYCRQVECLGSVDQSEFNVGYMFGSDGLPKMIHPSYGCPAMQNRRVAWKIGSSDGRDVISLVPEKLFVMASDLDEFLRGVYKNPEDELSEDGVGMNKDKMSDELRYLILAHDVFWANADRDEVDTQPLNKDVSDWLVNKFKLSKSLADRGASIIRPSWASIGRRPEKD